MINLKRIIFIILILVTMSLIFTSCNKKNTSENKSQETSVKTDDAESTSKSFSEEELSKYNGKDNKPAYIAVSGVVYDVTNSKEWKTGEYKDYLPGKDYTEILTEDPILESFSIVGLYAPAYVEGD